MTYIELYVVLCLSLMLGAVTCAVISMAVSTIIDILKKYL